MAHCGRCRRDDSTKVVTVYTKGSAIDKCNLCADPGDPDFIGATLYPVDKKMWPDWEVNPKGYKKVGDTLVATDETLSDLEAEVCSTKNADHELELAKKKKREFAAQKNLNPLTRAEIDSRVEAFRTQREEAEKLQRYKDAGLVLP